MRAFIGYRSFSVWNALCCLISLRKMLLLVVLLFALLGLPRFRCNLLSGHLCQMLTLKENLCAKHASPFESRFLVPNIWHSETLFKQSFQSDPHSEKLFDQTLGHQLCCDNTNKVFATFDKDTQPDIFLHLCIFPRKSKSRFSFSVKIKPHDSGCCCYFNSLFCWIDKIQ